MDALRDVEEDKKVQNFVQMNISLNRRKLRIQVLRRRGEAPPDGLVDECIDTLEYQQRVFKKMLGKVNYVSKAFVGAIAWVRGRRLRGAGELIYRLEALVEEQKQGLRKLKDYRKYNNLSEVDEFIEAFEKEKALYPQIEGIAADVVGAMKSEYRDARLFPLEKMVKDFRLEILLYYVVLFYLGIYHPPKTQALLKSLAGTIISSSLMIGFVGAKLLLDETTQTYLETLE